MAHLRNAFSRLSDAGGTVHVSDWTDTLPVAAILPGMRIALFPVLALIGPALSCGRGAPDGAPVPDAVELFSEPEVLEASVRCGRPEVPTILESLGGGGALFDADGDGDLDLFVAEPGPYPGEGGAGESRLFLNDGSGRFERQAAALSGFALGCAVADVDADGKRDVLVTRYGTDVLLGNAGGGRLRPVWETEEDGFSTSAAFFDADLDGDLDLYVVHYVRFDADDPPMHGKDGRVCLWNEIPVYCGPQGLEPEPDHFYRNDDGRLVEATEAHGFLVEPGYGLGVLEGDFDEDGDVDLYVANDSTPNFLFRNDGDGRFEEVGLLSGCALSGLGREQAGMGVAAGDFDGDGDEDLAVTNFSMDDNALYVNEGGAVFHEASAAVGIGPPSRTLLGWGVAFLDADLDADLDLVCANGHVYPQADTPGTGTRYEQPDLLFLNEDGRFRPVRWSGSEPSPSRALLVGDVDGDRLADLIVFPRDGALRLLRGRADPTRSLVVRLAGRPGNPDGVGALVDWIDSAGLQRRRVRTSGGFQAACAPEVFFAFGGPGTLRVRFPDGRVVERPVARPGLVTIDGSAP